MPRSAESVPRAVRSGRNPCRGLPPSPTPTVTVIASHRGEDGMGAREIARALNCSRETVREIRDGERQSPHIPKGRRGPSADVAVGLAGHRSRSGSRTSLKFIWEEKAQHLTTYSDFRKQFYRGLTRGVAHVI